MTITTYGTSPDEQCFTFHCARCGIVLTQPLRLLEDASLLSEKEAKDHVPAGRYWIAPELDLPGGYYTEAVGCYLVNLKDVLDVSNHPDRGRLYGCCGLDGCDGRNKVCPNGHEVGTERSDCWMAHSMALDPDCVRIEPATRAEE